MPILFDGELHVHYGQFYVESRTHDLSDMLAETRAGQSNGLCGAAVPGFLFLATGLHTGNVVLTVELLDGPPPVGDEWEDVVEVSFRPESQSVRLMQWAGEASWPLPLRKIDYRVRYCATGMDSGRLRDTRMDGEPVLDRYLLQLWPDHVAPDAVVRETSQCAGRWHAHARTLPPPPTPEQRAEAKRRERRAKEQARQEAARAAEVRRWGGRLPDERIRHVNGALPMAQLDRDLLDELANLDSATQRAIAVWAARWALAAAGLADLDWVAPVIAALRRGEPLPPPFDDLTRAYEQLDRDTRVRYTVVASYDGRHERVSQQHMAVPAPMSAAAAEPLAAAVETLFHAVVTAGSGYRRLLTEVRHAFMTPR